jgi:hypothetical protein
MAIVPVLLNQLAVHKALGGPESPISRSTLLTLVTRGEFPPPVRVTVRTHRWPLPVVEAWIAAKANGAIRLAHQRRPRPLRVPKGTVLRPPTPEEQKAHEERLEAVRVSQEAELDRRVALRTEQAGAKP